MTTDSAALAERHAVLTALRAAPAPCGVTGLLRLAGLPPHRKAAVRKLLHTLALEGALAEQDLAGKIRGVRDLPMVRSVVVTGRNHDGRLTGRPVEDGPDTIFLIGDVPGSVPLTAGMRVLARLRPLGRNRAEGRVLAFPDAAPTQFAAFCRPDNTLTPVGAETSVSLALTPDSQPCQPGNYVIATTADRQTAWVEGTLGQKDDPSVISLLGMVSHGLPETFPAAVLAEASHFTESDTVTLLAEGRDDLRDLPFVTIDGEDSRDFDDAVCISREGQGFRLLIAIADVAHYVRSGSACDQEARRRGQSVYFADRVVPMLPPHLSEDLCSLLPGRDRPVILSDILIGPDGEQQAASIRKAVLRSHARLTYQQLQHACDNAAPLPSHLPDDLPVLLTEASDLLSAAALRRGVYVPHRDPVRVSFFPGSHSLELHTGPLPPTHDIIANFMIQAGIAAAEQLRSSGTAIFRAHPSLPDDEAGILRPASYTHTPSAHAALALRRYAHVTSPIRRYADLVCQRALTDPAFRETDLPALARHLTIQENRAASAEREARTRLIALAVAQQTDRIFTGHVTGAPPIGARFALTEPPLTGLLVSEGMSRAVMAAESGRIYQDFSGTEDHASAPADPLCLRNGTELRVRPAGVNPVTFECLFVPAGQPCP